MDGFADPKKPVIVPKFTPTIAILTDTDTLFLTKMQKWENRQSDSPYDNIKMQVG